MAVSHVATGARTTGNAGTTTTAVARPATGNTAGSITICGRTIKPETATGTAEAGWTQTANATGGTGTSGADTGPTRVVADYQVLAGGESGSVTFDQSGTTNSVASCMITYNQAGSGFEVVSTTGADNTHANGRTAAGSAISLQAGDVIVAFVASCSDNATAYTSPAFTATGMTFTTTERLAAGGVSQGNDCGIAIFEGTITAGAQASVAPTLTLSGGTLNCGPVAFVRLREIAAPAITQAAYRWYDEGTESGAVALANQDTAVIGDITNGDATGTLRIRLQSTTATAIPATDDWQLQYEKNASGSWINVSAVTTNVSTYDSPNLTNAAATSNRLTGGTGSFVAGKVSEDSLMDDLGWGGNNFTELVYALKVKAADLAASDTLRFRVLRNGATTGMTFTQTPTINIIRTPPNSGSATVTWAEASTAAGKKTQKGDATASYTEVLTTAAGKRSPKAAATVAHSWTQTANGQAPAGPPKEGSAAVTWTVSTAPLVKHLYAPTGTASTPDPGVLADTMTLIFKIRGPADFSGQDRNIAGQGAASPNQSWRVNRRGTTGATGLLGGYWSANGTSYSGAFMAATTSAGTGVDRQSPQIQAIGFQRTAVPNVSVRTSHSLDGGFTWTSTGSVTASDQGGIPFNGTDPVTVGRAGSGSSWDNRIYWVECWSGFDATGTSPRQGTMLWRFDATEHVSGTSWVDARGLTWTLTNASAIVEAVESPVGKRTPKADTSLTHTWVTTAEGARTPKGSTSSSHAWTTEAAGVAGIVFTPDMLTGLAVWLDASQLGLADGASVAVWSDLSGANNHGNVVAGSFAPPTLKANVLRGLPVVRFVTQGGKVRGTCPTVTTNLTVVYLVRRWGPTAGRAFTVTYPGSASYNFLVGYHTSSADWMYDNGNVNPPLGWVGDQQNPPTAWRLYGADATSTPVYKSRFFIDGVQTGVDWGGGQGMGGTYNLSGYADTEETMDCDIAEFILYDRKLTDVERIKVENYMREKWFGPPAKEGSATADHTWALNANGRRDPKSSGIAIYVETPAAIGKFPAKATGVVTYHETLTAAVGKRTPKAATTTSWTEATAATGKRIPKATMAVTHTWALTAAGVKPIVAFKSGSATVTYTETLAAAGKRAPKAASTATYTETLTLAGKRTPKASTTVTHQWTIDVKSDWTPDLLTGLKAWFDASQLALADGANVTLWPDLSGNSLDLTPIAAGRPTYQTNELNGLGVIRFTGAAGEHLTTSNYRTFQHFFLVAKYQYATFDNYSGLLGSDSDLILVGGGPGAVDFYSYTQSLYYKNGVSLPTLSGPMGAWAHMGITKTAGWINFRLWIGSDRGFADREWDGDVAEVIGYDRVLSDPERVQVENYLVQKWLPPPKQGTSAVTWAVSSTVVGKRAPKATATPTYTETPVPVGKRTPKAAATASWTATATAVGKRTPKATAATTYVETPAAAGKKTPKASSTTTDTWTLSAAGKRIARATTTVTFRWQTAAAGKRASKGTVLVIYEWAPVANGTYPANAAGDVSYEFVTLAEGAAGFQMTGLWNGQEVTAMMLGEDAVSNFALTP